MGRKVYLELDYDNQDKILEQVLKNDADALWKCAANGCTESAYQLDALKVYMTGYCGFEWTPPAEIDLFSEVYE